MKGKRKCENSIPRVRRTRSDAETREEVVEKGKQHCLPVPLGREEAIEAEDRREDEQRDVQPV